MHCNGSNQLLWDCCAGVWFFFDKTLTLRAVRLVETTNSLAKGKLSVRSKLKVQMSWLRYQQLQPSSEPNSGASAATPKLAAQREELLNLLASQIRNSLDLEAILSTVSETRELLGVDRCNFVWCYFDAPSFDLSHEARLPDLLDNTRLKTSTTPI